MRSPTAEREREDRLERQAAREEQLRRRAEGVDLSKVDKASPFRKTSYGYDSLEEAFPYADPWLTPFGSNVLVQLRTPKTKTSGGIIITEGDRETDMWNTQVAKVIAYGPVAFHNRDTMRPWPECIDSAGNFRPWAAIGTYVRVPKYGGDRMWAETPGHADGKAIFVLFTDLDLKGAVPEDKVLGVVAYI